MSVENYIEELGLVYFLFDRKPENLPTSEILISSLQRQLGLSSVGNEGFVYSEENKDALRRLFNEGHLSDVDNVLRNNLRSTIHFSARKDYVKYSHRHYSKPFIPEISSFVHASRAGGNPWVPGRYILEELYLGAPSDQEYLDFVDELRSLFIINTDSSSEDILAKFLQNSLKDPTSQSASPFDLKSLRTLSKKSMLKGHLQLHEFMYVNFRYILRLKSKMTRYRWLNFMEGYLRFFLYMTAIYRLNLPVFCKKSLILKEETLNTSFTFVDYGESRQNINKNALINYVKDSLYLTEILSEPRRFNELNDFYKYCSNLEQNVDKIELKVIKHLQGKFKDDYNLKYLKNINEFIDYIGIERKDSEKIVSDNTYFFKIQGRSYTFDFGKSLLFLFVNMCGMHLGDKTFSSSDFVSYMSQFGLNFEEKKFADITFLKRLKDLGVLLEMSDSESGVLLKSFWYEF